MENQMEFEYWTENFRMTRETSFELCDSLQLYLTKKTTRIRKPISVEKQIGIFLYYISEEGKYRKTANAFGVSCSSVFLIKEKVSAVIVMVLGPKLIKLPTSGEERTYLIDKHYENRRFPQCLGAIDGTHIATKEPANQYTNFINQKGYYLTNV